MEYRSLGMSGLKVSPLCLGTMMFGGATDEATARRIVDARREQGVNFIDTADGYNGGKSEEIVGRAIREHRSWWVLATKCANPTGQGPNARGLSRRHVFARGGGQPAPARHRRDRPAVSAQGGSRDAAGRDGACAGRSDPRGKDPLFRRVELPELAGGGDLPAVRRGRASTGRWPASRCTTR